MSEIVIVCVDHGNGNIKGEDFTTSAGIKKLPMKPPIEKGTISYKGNYYAFGGQKTDIQKSKTEDESTLIQTMIVIAEKLKRLGKSTADIRLGAGLPLTRMGAEKEDLKTYLSQNKRLDFIYEGNSYSVNIVSVDIFPQGYSGVVDRLDTFSQSTLVVDIGSWTVDIMPIIEGQPDVARCKSLPLGTITAMNDINESLRQKFGEEAEVVIIKDIMINGTSNINEDYLKVIQDGLYEYVNNLMNALRSLKFNSALTEFVFIGGGSSIINHFLKDKGSNMTIIDDVCINAKGYAKIMKHKYGVSK